jgi:NADH-quinone oxidoreductase subunit J
MTLLVTGAEVAFWLLAPVMVLGALGMILARKPVHSALCLAAVMISLAVQYAAQDAPFLFAVQIIVYTGAILMLFLFVLMLVGVDVADSLVETIKGQRTLAVLAGLGFGSLLVFAVGNAIVTESLGLLRVNTENGGNTQGIAALVFNRYVFAFEATSALLITAAVGAMVLAHRERLVAKRTQADLATSRMRRYAETGQHPGPLPTPGVFARHNAVDTPALLPDGSVSELSVSRTLRARGNIRSADELVEPIDETVNSIAPTPEEEPPTFSARPGADGDARPGASDRTRTK